MYFIVCCLLPWRVNQLDSDVVFHTSKFHCRYEMRAECGSQPTLPGAPTPDAAFFFADRLLAGRMFTILFPTCTIGPMDRERWSLVHLQYQREIQLILTPSELHQLALTLRFPHKIVHSETTTYFCRFRMYYLVRKSECQIKA